MNDNNINRFESRMTDAVPMGNQRDMDGSPYMTKGPRPAETNNSANPAMEDRTTRPAEKNMKQPLHTDLSMGSRSESALHGAHAPAQAYDRNSPFTERIPHPLTDQPTRMTPYTDYPQGYDFIRQVDTYVIPPPLQAGAWDEEGPPRVMDTDYIAGYLRTLIGRTIRAEFVIGMNQSTDRAGILREVGVNYFVLEDLITRNLVMCDLYSVYFVIVMR